MNIPQRRPLPRPHRSGAVLAGALIGLLLSLPALFFTAIPVVPDLNGELYTQWTLLLIPVALLCLAAAWITAWATLTVSGVRRPGAVTTSALAVAGAMALLIDVIVIAGGLVLGALAMVLAYDASRVGGDPVTPGAVSVVIAIIIVVFTLGEAVLVTLAFTRAFRAPALPAPTPRTELVAGWPRI